MVRLIGKLHDTGLLTIQGVLCLLGAIMTTGVNLRAMLRVAAGLTETLRAAEGSRLFQQTAELLDPFRRQDYHKVVPRQG